MDSDTSLTITIYCIVGFLGLSSCFIACRNSKRGCCGLKGPKWEEEHFPILNSAPDITPAEHPFFRL